MGEASRKKRENRETRILEEIKRLGNSPTENMWGTYLSLSISIVIPACAAMGYTVGPSIAIPLWLIFLAVVAHMIWTRPNTHKSIKLMGTLFAVAGVSVLIYRSYVGPVAVLAKTEVYFFDKMHMPAKEIPFADITQFPLNFSNILRDNPPRKFPVKPNETRQMMSVIVRNPTDIPIKNATVSIVSNVPITGETNGAKPFSDTQTSYELRTLKPYRNAGVESYFSISFSPVFDRPIILAVIVESDNSKPYTGVQVFNLFESEK